MAAPPPPSPILRVQTFKTSDKSDLFMLPSVKFLKIEDKYFHEWGGAELFRVYYPFLKENNGGWSYEPFIKNSRADRGMKLRDKFIYFEVDRATEAPKEIIEKRDLYIQYARETDTKFHVIFTIMENPRQTVRKRGETINRILSEFPRGNQFLVASHKNLTADPIGNFLYNPAYDELISLKDLL